mgnify:CR=1 FL=1
MAVWIVTFQADPPRYEVSRDGQYATGQTIPERADSLAYWRAAQAIKANVIRRYDDPEPVFAANSNEPEAVAFAEMLNA